MEMRLNLSLFLLLLGIQGFSQTISYNCPPNIDFELKDLSYWDCYTGTARVENGKNILDLIPSPPVPGRHEIMSSPTDRDKYGKFPTLCPYGDAYSAKLGNDNVGSEAEGLSYTFQIPLQEDTFRLTYYYAVVFQDPNHAREQQPRFFVSAYDAETGVVINCASYDYVSNSSIPGFKRSTVDTSVLYKDWTPASLDFTGLAGRKVKLEFKTGDCTLGGHFGYAYFDVSTGCGGVIANAAYCRETNNAILNAPYGFETYTWYNADYSAVIGHDQSVTLSPPPAVTSTFHVDMIPYVGYGCRDTAFAKLTVLPVPDTPMVYPTNYCQFDLPVALSATGALGNTILWYNSVAGGVGTDIPPIPSASVTGSFDYYVSQKQLFGCESFRTKATVTVSATPINSFGVNSTRQCEEINKFVFTNNTSNTVAGRQYLWDFGDGKTDTSESPTHVYSTYGSYYVKLKVLNPPVCATERNTNIVVVPKPIARFNYPPLICENNTAITLIDNSNVPSGIGVISKWWWDISGQGQSGARNPQAFYSGGGPLPVKLVVSTTEGCNSDTNTVVIPVHYNPVAAFRFGKLMCDNEPIYFTDQSAMPAPAAPEYIAKWNWEVDNNFNSGVPNPVNALTAGKHHIKLILQSNVGCDSKPIDTTLFIFSKPYIALSISDSCVFRNIAYTANVLPGPGVAAWYWDFANGLRPGPASYSHVYTNDQQMLITLMGETSEGCKDTVIRPFAIYYNRANAGRDTTVAWNQPLQLDAHGEPGTFYTWSPSTGLNDAASGNPIAVYDKNQLYELNTLSKEGCDSHSKIFVTRYNGPDLYVANAFTPNGDGTNDVLHVKPIGIKAFGYFAVYNRYGQLIYRTTDYHMGWDGRFNGTYCEAGTYVFYTTATDYKGSPMFKKGSVILLR